MTRGQIASIAIAPIKGCGLQYLDEAMIGLHGIAEDRRFFVVGAGERQLDARRGILSRIRQRWNETTRELTLNIDGTEISGVVTHGARARGRVSLGRRPRGRRP